MISRTCNHEYNHHDHIMVVLEVGRLESGRLEASRFANHKRTIAEFEFANFRLNAI